MKICFLSSMHSPLDKRVFDKEAVTLAEAGFDVVHVCPGEGEKNQSGVELITYTRQPGLRHRLFGLFRIYRIARTVDADAYHCNELDSWLVGTLLRLFHRRKCVFDVHEHYPSLMAERFRARWLRRIAASFVLIYYRVLTPFTDCIVLAKASVARDFPKGKTSFVTIKNYAPRPPSKKSGNEVECESRPARNAFTVVHLGLFGKSRGWPQVLDALSRLKDAHVHLHIVGTINDGTELEFRQEVERLGLANHVKLTEWLPYREAFSLLEEADAGLIAFQPDIQNHIFAMPHKMFDYMAAGIPVICPEFAVEVAPVVEESKAGILVDPSDPKSLEAAIRKLLDSTALRQKLGRNGKKAVNEIYNWETEGQRLVDTYIAMGIFPGDHS